MSRKTTNEVLKRIRAKFGADVEIVDAKEPLRLQPMPEDQVGADPKCPDNCLLVHTAHRMFQSSAAIFWKSSAYIDLIDKDGLRRVLRYIIPSHSEKVLAGFDRGIPLKQGTGIILNPPPVGARLGAKHKHHSQYMKSPVGRALRAVDAARISVRRLQAAAEGAAEREREAKKTLKPAKLAVVHRQADDAKKRLQVAREKLDVAEKKADTLRKAAPFKKRHYVFDLTTRNGARGEYKFVSV